MTQSQKRQKPTPKEEKTKQKKTREEEKTKPYF